MVTYPSGWNTYDFSEYFSLLPNNTLPRAAESESGTVANIHYGDVLVRYGETMGRKTCIPKLTPLAELTPDAFLQSNDVIFADTAEDQTVGKCTQLVSIDAPVVSGLHTIPCRPRVATAPGFLGYYLNSRLFHDQLIPYITGIKVSSISKASIQKTTLTLPSFPEQRAIADVLSGFDEHLSNLDELITKKKAIRDGALEGLTSGSQRLSGFNDPWKEIPLGVIATINPATPLPDSFIYIDLESVKGAELVSFRRQDRATAPSRAKRVAQSGDIFFQMVRPYQRNNYLFKSSAQNVVFSTGYAQIRTREVPEFLFAAVQQDIFVDQVLEYCTGTSYPAITPTALKIVNVRLPESISEQRAIADVLSGMDKEIRLLAEERAKVQCLKLGVMDDLLTGRVRLSLEEEEA